MSLFYLHNILLQNVTLSLQMSQMRGKSFDLFRTVTD